VWKSDPLVPFTVTTEKIGGEGPSTETNRLELADPPAVNGTLVELSVAVIPGDAAATLSKMVPEKPLMLVNSSPDEFVPSTRTSRNGLSGEIAKSATEVHDTGGRIACEDWANTGRRIKQNIVARPKAAFEILGIGE